MQTSNHGRSGQNLILRYSPLKKLIRQRSFASKAEDYSGPISVVSSTTAQFYKAHVLCALHQTHSPVARIGHVGRLARRWPDEFRTRWRPTQSRGHQRWRCRRSSDTAPWSSCAHRPFQGKRIGRVPALRWWDVTMRVRHDISTPMRHIISRHSGQFDPRQAALDPHRTTPA